MNELYVDSFCWGKFPVSCSTVVIISSFFAIDHVDCKLRFRLSICKILVDIADTTIGVLYLGYLIIGLLQRISGLLKQMIRARDLVCVTGVDQLFPYNSQTFEYCEPFGSK